MINRGCVLDEFQTRFFINFDSILEGLGEVLGVIWGALGGHLGVLLGCVSQGSLQGEPGTRFGRIWAPFWRHLGTILETFWRHFGEQRRKLGVKAINKRVY